MNEKEKQPEENDTSPSDKNTKQNEDVREEPVKEQSTTKTKEDTKEEPTDEDSDSEKKEPQEDQDKKTFESPKKQSKPGKEKQKKGVKEQESGKKKDIKRDENFSYIVRIANSDLDGNKTIEYGLSQIKGIGHRMSTFILNVTGIDRKSEVGTLTDEQIEKLRVALENLSTSAPIWMMNRQKDFDTGEDMHLISTDVAMRLRDDINMMKMIRCYRGVRHEQGLPVRGQRTKANGRIGLAMGVQKRTVQASQAAKKEA